MTTVFISLVVVVAVLLILLLNIGCTGMFTDARPTGDRAMGLIVPIFGLPIAIVAITLAALLATGRVSTTAMGTLAPSPLLAGVLVVVLTFGAALAAGMAFMLWCEPGAVGKRLEFATVPVGILAGVCGPVILAVMLLIGVWMPKSSAAAALESSQASGLGLKAGLAALCLLAVIGYGLGGSMLFKGLKFRAANRAAKIASMLEDHAKWEAQQSKPPKQRITEDFADFSPTTPLWYILVYLLDQANPKAVDDECRAIVVQRALEVPDVDAQLHGCMKGTYSLYRDAAARFLIAVPEADLAAHRDAWGRALLAGLQATGDEIRGRADWLCETASSSSPDPIDHVRSLLGASDRFKGWSEYAAIREQLQNVTDAAGKLNADARRETLLNMLADAGYRPA